MGCSMRQGAAGAIGECSTSSQRQSLFTRQNEEELAALLATEYPDSPRFVLKDPRVSRLAPLYLEALSRQGIDPMIVIVLREPLQSAKSLNARDGMVIQEGLLLWLRYQLDAERFTRGCARVILNYDELLADWRAQWSRVAAAFDLPSAADPPASTAIDDFVSPQLRHHDPAEVAAQVPDFQDWLASAFTALHRLSQDVGTDQQLRGLDDVRQSFDAVGQPFAPISRPTCSNEIAGQRAPPESGR